jgi:hypothetical protein
MSSDAGNWRRDPPPFAEVEKGQEEQRTKSGTPQPATSRPFSDYLLLDILRIVCLVGACLSLPIGIVVALATESGFPLLVGLAVCISFGLASAWTELAIDIARHAKQAAAELKEVRLLLAQQRDVPTKAKNARE